jgi:hypothetical protein
MNATKEALIIRLIDTRIKNIRDQRMEEEWMADVMNFGWVGYAEHRDKELLEDAEELGLDNTPTLEELQA